MYCKREACHCATNGNVRFAAICHVNSKIYIYNFIKMCNSGTNKRHTTPKEKNIFKVSQKLHSLSILAIIEFIICVCVRVLSFNLSMFVIRSRCSRSPLCSTLTRSDRAHVLRLCLSQHLAINRLKCSSLVVV